MAEGGRIELQWDSSPEYEGDAPGSRGHVEGPALLEALHAAGVGATPQEIAPETDYQYSIEPSRRVGGADPNQDAPASPVPERRMIITITTPPPSAQQTPS
jgi:hypothetical protein